MAEVNINEINSDGNVDFDQAVDSDTLIAGAGGVVAGGNISDAAVNTGRNSGILAAATSTSKTASLATATRRSTTPTSAPSPGEVTPPTWPARTSTWAGAI